MTMQVQTQAPGAGENAPRSKREKAWSENLRKKLEKLEKTHPNPNAVINQQQKPLEELEEVSGE